MEPMYILIAGARDVENTSPLIEKMHYIISNFPSNVVIVNGACKGIDLISSYIARQKGLNVIEELADWNKYGKAAGPIRNKLMLDKYPIQYAYLFHPDIENSKGTKNMRNLLIRYGIRFVVIN